MGSIRNLSIGGSLLGAQGILSGSVGADELGQVKIGGNMLGGQGVFSARIFADSMGNVSIGGSLRGDAERSGRIEGYEAIGNVTIGGDLEGGLAPFSGAVEAAYGPVGTVSTIGNVIIRGSILGGGKQSGFLHGESIGNISIGHDLLGGSITGNASLEDSGLIFSEGRIASVTIGKSLIAGADMSTGALTRCGAIVAGSLGPVKIGVGIVGSAANPALIIAKGLAVNPATGFDLAIASLTVKGDVRFSSVLAGFDSNGVPANADAAIGAVSVGGNWVASNLVAGAQAGPSGFGVGSTLQTVGNTGLVARIASIAVKGVVQGTVADGDQFGFVAEHIAKLSIGGKPIALTAGPSNDTVLMPTTSDVHLVEVTVAPV
jgi:hypothetical protein